MGALREVHLTRAIQLARPRNRADHAHYAGASTFAGLEGSIARVGLALGGGMIGTRDRAQSQTSTGRATAPRRAPTEPPIDSLAPASIFPPRGVGWGPLRRLVATGRVRKGHGEGYWLYGFVGVQAGVSRPNSDGWCQGRAGTCISHHGAAEMGGGVGGWRGWCCPHPPSATKAGVKSLVWRK